MKKITIAIAFAFATTALTTSCDQSAPNATMETEADTLSYTLGMLNGEGMKQNFAQSAMDTTCIDAFLRGVVEGTKMGSSEKEKAYLQGLMMGQQFGSDMVSVYNARFFGNDSTKTISLKNFLSAYINVMKGEKTLIEMEEARTLTDAIIERLMAEQMEKEYGGNKKAGEQFLAENAKKDSVKTLPSGVQYKVLKEGKGDIAKADQTISLHYEGRLIDGTVFDSSYKRGQPIESIANGFVKGFNEAVQMMPVGSTWEVYIPQELAYGANARGVHIKPFSALIFKIEMISIVDKNKK